MTGDGIDEFFDAVERKADEFNRDYKPELERRIKERQQEKEGKKHEDLAKVMEDMKVGEKPKPKHKEQVGQRQDDDEDEEDEEDAREADEYADVRPDDDEALQRRYAEELRRQGLQTNESDRSFARYVAQSGPSAPR